MTNDNGVTRELQTVEEFQTYFPNSAPPQVCEYEDTVCFHFNMTHNLSEMARHVPIVGTGESNALSRTTKQLSAYELLWHPERNPLLEHVMTQEEGFEFTSGLIQLNAEYIRQVLNAYVYIASHHAELSLYNPVNGYGNYIMMSYC